MFLHMTERKLREAIGDASLSLPYWDWERHAEVPEPCRGVGHALAAPDGRERPVGPLPAWRRDPGAALAAADFERFGGGPLLAGSGQATAPGLLELGPFAHVPLGLGSAFTDRRAAAFDPLFLFHLANVDRLWEVWRARGGRNPLVSSWLEQAFAFTDEQGERTWRRVEDHLNPAQLGYAYDRLDSATGLADGPAGRALPGPGEGRRALWVRAREVRSINPGIGEVGIQLSADSHPLPAFDDADLPAIRAFAQRQELEVYLKLEGFVVPPLPVTLRVYLNPEAGADTGVGEADGFVGAISVWPLPSTATPAAIEVNLPVTPGLRPRLEAAPLFVTVVVERPAGLVEPMLRGVSLSLGD
jgi:hypothetical protein